MPRNPRRPNKKLGQISSKRRETSRRDPGEAREQSSPTERKKAISPGRTRTANRSTTRRASPEIKKRIAERKKREGGRATPATESSRAAAQKPAQKPVVKKSVAKKPVVVPKPTTAKKVATSKTKSTSGEKPKKKGRVSRSIAERSKLPALIAILILGGVIAGAYWYQGRAAGRMVDNLSRFRLSKEERQNYRDFNPGLNGLILDAKECGSSIVSPLLQNYSSMAPNQQMAAIIVLGELGAAEAANLMCETILSGDEMMAYFASASSSKIGEPTVSPLVKTLEKAPEEKHEYILMALGRSQTKKAMQALIDLLATTKGNTKKLTIEAFSYFTKDIENIVRALYKVVVEEEDSFATAALQVLQGYREKGFLDKIAPPWVNTLEQDFLLERDPQRKARQIRLMGIFGLCRNSAGQDYISTFRNLARQSLATNKGNAERAAAARVIGTFSDSEYFLPLFRCLDHEDPEVTRGATSGLIQLSPKDLPETLLASSLASSDRDHVLMAVAEIFDNSLLYIGPLKIENRVVNFLLRAMEKAQGETVHNLAKVVEKYSYGPLVNAENVSVEKVIQVIAKTGEGEYLARLLHRIVKSMTGDQASRTLIAAMGEHKKSQVVFSKVLLNFVKSQLPSYHAMKQKQPQYQDWLQWQQRYEKLEKALRQAEDLVRTARKKIETKDSKKMAAASEELQQAKSIYENITKETGFEFKDQQENIRVLLYESQKARSVK